MISFLMTTWWIYIPIVGALLYFTWRNNQKVKALKEVNHILLSLEIPRANDKKELAAEQMFASLHGILRSKKERFKDGGLQEHISYEIASIGNRIRFFVWVPEHLKNFVEGQIYAQYPTVQIHELPEDYTSRDFTSTPVIHTAEISLTDNDALPIKTFPSFEVDPLAAMTATLAKLAPEGEEMWIQVLARPIDDNWHKKSASFISRVKNGGGINSSGWLGSALGALWKPPESSTTSSDISERDKTRIAAAEEKSRKLGYQVKVRVAYLGTDRNEARLRMQAIVGTFKQFNSTNLNSFKIKNPSFDSLKLAEYRARFFIDKGFIFNIEELASLYHLPHTTVETPGVVWASAKTAEPPSNLPVTGGKFIDGVSPFGITNFRGTSMQFGIKRGDRGRHMYIIGQTGTGKSGLLTLLTLSDIFHNEGFAVVDPHGDYAMDIMKFIPENRIKDVVYFNPSDTEFPVGFNPMEVMDQNMKGHTSSELVGVLKRMFENSWGPRLEYILRYTILALLDTPGTTMLDITRMLTDVKFRKTIVDNLQDVVVKQFWTIEFASWNEKFATEAVAPILNKVGAFVANPMVRNIVGQSKSSFNVRQIMDEGKILIVNLSRGLMGEDNAAIMGALMVTKIQLAAMSRANVHINDRRPFYLYVDEFQNFATDSFAVILSEARKYGLNLTVANQYISQMPPEVKDAVFGNVGSMVVLRVGAEDGSSLVKYFEPHFETQDILQQNNFHFLATMAIDGEKTQAFSGKTLRLPTSITDFSPQIIENTRRNYSVPKEQIAATIMEASGTKDTTTNQTNQSAVPRPIDPTTGEPKKKKTRRGSRGGKKTNLSSEIRLDKPQ